MNILDNFFYKHTEEKKFTCKTRNDYDKIVFLYRKVAFESFFANCKNEMLSFAQSSLCSNLFSKLKKSCTKESIYILQFSKNDSNATFLYKNKFFCNRSGLNFFFGYVPVFLCIQFESFWRILV